MIMNSDATLDLGPVARTLSTPLRYALVAPIIQGGQVTAVVTLYSGEKFDKDHSRLLESAVNLFQSSSQLTPEGGTRAASGEIARPKFH